jgi:hypothetical protein
MSWQRIGEVPEGQRFPAERWSPGRRVDGQEYRTGQTPTRLDPPSPARIGGVITGLLG